MAIAWPNINSTSAVEHGAQSLEDAERALKRWGCALSVLFSG